MDVLFVIFVLIAIVVGASKQFAEDDAKRKENRFWRDNFKL